MANVIKLKRGSGSDPSASDLVVGEVAIRTDSGKLFTKKDNGTIAEISGSGGGSDIFINTLSSSSGSGGGSATFNGTATRFTLSNPPTVSAQQLLVSINGVVQKPNSGTSPSEGFAIDGNDIIFAAAPATGSDFFIVTYGSLNIGVPADNSVTSAKIADGAIVNADINASAAIQGTKISPDFGSQNIVTTGGLTIDTSTLHVDTSNNRVGIGTTSPSQELTVAGSDPIISVQEASVSSQVDIGTGTSTGFINIQKADGTRSIQFNGSGVSYFNSGGNVGIGTTNPSKTLVINENDSECVAIIKSSDTGTAGVYLGGQSDEIKGGIIFDNNTNKLTLRGHNNSIAQTIDSSGNVGIGTTSPIARIDSQGNVSSTTQFSGFQGLRIQNSNGAALGVTADLNFVAGTGSDNRGAVIGVEFTSGFGNDLYFATNPNSVSSNDTPIERLRITSAGHVSIEGANNTTFDHVAVLTLKGTDAYNSGNAGSGITFGGKYNSSGSITTLAQISGIKEDTSDGTYDGALTFGVRNDAEGVNIERMRITSAGEVEIMQDKKLVFVYAGGSTHRASITADAADNLKFTTGSSDSRVMTIDGSGRVMIGVNDTSHASGNADDLCVGNNDSSAAHGITIGSNNAGSIRFSDSAHGSIGIINYDHASDQLAFYTHAAVRITVQSSGAAFSVPIQLGSGNSHNSAKLVIQGSGNNSGTNSIFIKNSDETPLFHVRNDGVIFTGTDGASPYNFTTSSSANVFVSSNGDLRRSTSSVRYKKDIADATFGLAEVLKLKPKTFKNNATGEFADDKTYAGFTAEDIHDLGLTEFVQYNEANEPDALAYGNMVALMAKAIQDLNAKVEALEAG